MRGHPLLVLIWTFLIGYLNLEKITCTIEQECQIANEEVLQKIDIGKELIDVHPGFDKVKVILKPKPKIIESLESAGIAIRLKHTDSNKKKPIEYINKFYLEHFGNDEKFKEFDNLEPANDYQIEAFIITPQGAVSQSKKMIDFKTFEKKIDCALKITSKVLYTNKMLLTLNTANCSTIFTLSASALSIGDESDPKQPQIELEVLDSERRIATTRAKKIEYLDSDHWTAEFEFSEADASLSNNNYIGTHSGHRHFLSTCKEYGFLVHVVRGNESGHKTYTKAKPKLQTIDFVADSLIYVDNPNGHKASNDPDTIKVQKHNVLMNFVLTEAQECLLENLQAHVKLHQAFDGQIKNTYPANFVYMTDAVNGRVQINDQKLADKLSTVIRGSNKHGTEPSTPHPLILCLKVNEIAKQDGFEAIEKCVEIENEKIKNAYYGQINPSRNTLQSTIQLFGRSNHLVHTVCFDSKKERVEKFELTLQYLMRNEEDESKENDEDSKGFNRHSMVSTNKILSSNIESKTCLPNQRALEVESGIAKDVTVGTQNTNSKKISSGMIEYDVYIPCVQL